MCGILGYYAFGSKRPDKDKLTKMFESLESRGKDASGFAYVKDKKLNVYKDCVRSSMLIKHQEWTDLNDLPKIMILHTRAKTKGEPDNNMNNHPLFNKDGLCIVHNGIIWNDDSVYKDMKVKRDAQVDSEVILAVLSSKKKNKRIKKVFDTLRGSYAFALIDVNSPDELVLVRNSNPVKLCFDVNNDILYFCSERDIIYDTLNIETTTIRGFDIEKPGFHFFEVEDDHALWIGPEGVQKYEEYESRGYNDYYYSRGYNRWNGEWESDKKSKQMIIPYKNETEIIPDTDDKDDAAYGDDWMIVFCPHCGEQIYVEYGSDNWCDYCNAYLGHHYSRNLITM